MSDPCAMVKKSEVRLGKLNEGSDMSWRAACGNQSEVVELDARAANEMFDDIARKRMGMSGEEFLRRYDAGDFNDVTEEDIPGIVDMEIVLPLVR